MGAGLGACPDLNTVILKQNQISHLGQSLNGCTALAKLSVAHNKLSDVGSALAECSSLAELRVSHNALTSLPQDLRRNARLKIIEAGGNQIAEFQQVQVLSQLPSLHQLNLRGCPIADTPDYQEQLLQQVPMLDVLDSRKVHKSGMRASAKPAVPATQPKQSLDRKAEGKPGAASTDASTDDSPIKSKKRQLQPQTDTLGGPILKKPKKEKVAASRGVAGNADGRGTVTAAASKFHEKPNGGEVAEVEGEMLNSGKKHKSKEKKKKSQQQAAGADNSRSFLADVLDPEKPDTAGKAAVKMDGQHPTAALATAGGVNVSGLVKVVDVRRSTKTKKKAKYHNSEEAESKSGNNMASALSGSSAAQVLQSGFGLDALQVGSGGTGCWN